MSHRLPVLLLAATMAAGIGCKEAVEEPAPEVVRPVKMFTVGNAGVIERSFPGRVTAADQVDLSFRVGGPLTRLPVLAGQEVRRGKVLAQIDPRDYSIQLASARARYEQAQADFDRVAALYERDAVSEAQLDQTRAARDMAQATLDDAEANLADTKLRAPFSGLVGEVFADNFQDVRPGQPILSLVAVEEIDIEVDLPESVVARIRIGGEDNGTIRASFDSAPGRSFPLQVVELAAQADPGTQTYRGTLRMKQPDGINILPGMTARVFGEDDNVDEALVVIPAAAVVAGEAGASHVWIVSEADMTVARRSVTTGGLTGKDGIEIVDGLRPGDTLVVSAVSRLRDGMQVSRLNQ